MRLAIVQSSVPGIFLTKFYKFTRVLTAKAAKWPHLSHVAQHLLAVPAASTSSERVFAGCADSVRQTVKSQWRQCRWTVIYPWIEIVLHRNRKLITYGLCNIGLHGLCYFAMTTL